MQDCPHIADRVGADCRFEPAARIGDSLSGARKSVAFAPAIVVPTVSHVAAGAYPRLRFQGSVPAEYGRNIAIDLATSTGTGNTLSILATSTLLTV